MKCRIFIQQPSTWIYEDLHISIRGSIDQLEGCWLFPLLSKLTSFYWPTSAELDGPTPTGPFRCVFHDWFSYHNNEPNIEFGTFFANFVHVYPTGPTTIQGIVKAHETLCNSAASLLEAKDFLPDAGYRNYRWQQPQKYNLKPIYRAIIIIMDRYIGPYEDVDLDEEGHCLTIDLEEHSKKQTVLLVRTGDESHLSAPIDFEVLRANSLCLPLARTDFPAASGNVVRVSLPNAVKFVADLQRREDTASPQPNAFLEMAREETERKAKQWVDERLMKADDEGIDNISCTWEAIRCVKATRMGEAFGEREPYKFIRYRR